MACTKRINTGTDEEANRTLHCLWEQNSIGIMDTSNMKGEIHEVQKHFHRTGATECLYHGRKKTNICMTTETWYISGLEAL